MQSNSTTVAYSAVLSIRSPSSLLPTPLVRTFAQELLAECHEHLHSHESAALSSVHVVSASECQLTYTLHLSLNESDAETYVHELLTEGYVLVPGDELLSVVSVSH